MTEHVWTETHHEHEMFGYSLDEDNEVVGGFCCLTPESTFVLGLVSFCALLDAAGIQWRQ